MRAVQVGALEFVPHACDVAEERFVHVPEPLPVKQSRAEQGRGKGLFFTRVCLFVCICVFAGVCFVCLCVRRVCMKWALARLRVLNVHHVFRRFVSLCLVSRIRGFLVCVIVKH